MANAFFDDLFREESEESITHGLLASLGSLINHRFNRLEDIMTASREQLNADLAQLTTTVQALGPEVSALAQTVTDAIARAGASVDFGPEDATVQAALGQLGNIGTQLSQVEASAASSNDPTPVVDPAPTPDPVVDPAVDPTV